MKKIIFLSIASFFCFLGTAFAIDAPAYPITELGDCANKAECANYCNQAENMTACISYAENNNMLSKEEISLSKKVAEKVREGKMPGGCKDKNSCETFCQNNIANLDECLSFADEIGISGTSIEEGKKIAKALKEGANLPGGCSGKAECETYCAEPSHIDECLDFGEASGIIGAGEIAEARKISEFIKNGETPGGCKRKAECDTYCQIESNFDECLAFAQKAGFLSEKEREMIKKTGGKGPGGCKSEEACATYCANPAHLDECVEFGVKTGMISEEEKENIEGGVEKLKNGLEEIPAEARGNAESCLNEVFGGKLQEVLNGTVTITKEQGEKIAPCMEGAVNKYIESQMPQGGGSSGGGMPSGTQGSPEEIPTIPSGVQGPPENIPTAPGGIQGPPANIPTGAPCSSPEECMKMFGPQQ
ncbi:MAG: hypothetical protein WC386_01575 [Candidatus Paceibacterota bacterium]|jgi:hypothetical protein